MHVNSLYKEHDCSCGKLPFGVCGAHNTISQMRTYHRCNRTFESSLILNVPQLDQNRGYVPACTHDNVGLINLLNCTYYLTLHIDSKSLVFHIQ